MTWPVRQWIAATAAIAATGLMVGLAIAATTGVNQSWSRGFSDPIRTLDVSGPGSVRVPS